VRTTEKLREVLRNTSYLPQDMPYNRDEHFDLEWAELVLRGLYVIPIPRTISFCVAAIYQKTRWNEIGLRAPGEALCKARRFGMDIRISRQCFVFKKRHGFLD
jgi:hypothetical protein